MKIKLNDFLKELLSKGWKQVEIYKGFPVLQHPNGAKAIPDINSKMLIPEHRFHQFVQKTIQKREATKLINKQVREKNKQIKSITGAISNDATKRNLGLIDFSPENWFSYARGYKTPKESVSYYEKKFLPQLQEAYTKLVNNKMLYYDPKLRTVMGIINGKPIPLRRTEDKLAYIVTHTLNGKKLYFNGEVASTGVPAEYKASFIKHGGNPSKPNWANTNLSAATHYSGGDKGLIGIFTTIDPGQNAEYFKGTSLTHIPSKPMFITPQNTNPTSVRFIGPNPVGAYVSNNPLEITEMTRPIIDHLATRELGRPIVTKMRVIGQDLPLKAILGNSGEFNMKNKNPFKVILPIALTSGGLYEATDQ